MIDLAKFKDAIAAAQAVVQAIDGDEMPSGRACALGTLRARLRDFERIARVLEDAAPSKAIVTGIQNGIATLKWLRVDGHVASGFDPMQSIGPYTNFESAMADLIALTGACLEG